MKNILKTSLFVASALILTACSDLGVPQKIDSTLKSQESTTTQTTTTEATTTTTSSSTTSTVATTTSNNLNTTLLSKDFSPIAGTYEGIRGGTFKIKADGTVDYEGNTLKIVGVTPDKGRVILTLQFLIDGNLYPDHFTFMHVTPAGVESPNIVAAGDADNINKNRIFVQGEGNNFFFLD